MAGKLIIVESPHKAQQLQKFLGSGYTVKASQGHIRDLQEKSLSINIEDNFKPEYVLSTGKKRIVDELQKLAAGAETVYLASDPDREGEAIAWHLSEVLGLDPSKTKRIAYNEVTKSAVENALQNPRNIDMNLVDAQQARRVLDRLVGFELSPVLWKKVKRGLSAGRVQSVALRLVVDREREISAFQNEASYKVEAIFNFEGNKVKGTLGKRFQTLEDARKFLEDSIGAHYSVGNVEKKEGKRFPAAPFTTSTLQQEAARKLRFPVGTTMRVAQSLYERGLITYMRTDSTNLASIAINTSKQFIINNFGEEYSHPRQYKTKNQNAQEAHEAIRPTFVENTSIEGTAQEQKLYNLIWKRTVASQMEEARILNTSVQVDIDRRSEKYAIQASEILFDGFLKLYMESSDDEEQDSEEVILPSMSVGNILEAIQVNADCKFSQAPYRFTQATLVKKLEELGIGRPSTYATIIDTLTKGRGYIVQGDKEGQKHTVENLCLKGETISSSHKTEVVGAEKDRLLPQDIGMIVTDYLVDHFKDILQYDFTANVEDEFDKIAEGELEWNKVIADFYAPFHSTVETTIAEGEYSRVSREIGVDPSDGQPLVAKFGQYGPYIQKGDGENKVYATLQKGQLIETITLEEALKLFQLPRTVGEYEGKSVIATKGKFGAYLKYGDKNVSLPRGTDPLSVTLEKCVEAIKADQEKSAKIAVIKEFTASDIVVMNGIYGPYIKHAGSNYKIPKGTDVQNLSEEDCKTIIESQPSTKSGRRYRKTKK